MTRLVVGLGNPGPEYGLTRHNAGFLTVDLLAENLQANYWKDEAGAKVALVRFGDGDLALAKPLTFMNVSGRSVKRLVDAYEVPVAELIVVHDDIDIPAGVVRAKNGGGHGGHNGLRSISKSVGTRDYLRVRVGIGRPPGRMDPADYVLHDFSGTERSEVPLLISDAADAVELLVADGLTAAQQHWHSR